MLARSQKMASSRKTLCSRCVPQPRLCCLFQFACLFGFQFAFLYTKSTFGCQTTPKSSLTSRLLGWFSCHKLAKRFVRWVARRWRDGFCLHLICGVSGRFCSPPDSPPMLAGLATMHMCWISRTFLVLCVWDSLNRIFTLSGRRKVFSKCFLVLLKATQLFETPRVSENC